MKISSTTKKHIHRDTICNENKRWSEETSTFQNYGVEGITTKKHEHREHNYKDPLYSSELVTDVVSTDTESDMVLNYTKLAFSLGLLRLNQNCAIAMGDGFRMMLVNQYFYLLNKHNNCPKYAFGI